MASGVQAADDVRVIREAGPAPAPPRRKSAIVVGPSCRHRVAWELKREIVLGPHLKAQIDDVVPRRRPVPHDVAVIDQLALLETCFPETGKCRYRREPLAGELSMRFSPPAPG